MNQGILNKELTACFKTLLTAKIGVFYSKSLIDSVSQRCSRMECSNYLLVTCGTLELGGRLVVDTLAALAYDDATHYRVLR